MTSVDWSLESLFGRKIERACPAARSSIVTVDTSMSSDPSQLTPEHTYLDDNKPTYDILSSMYISVYLVTRELITVIQPPNRSMLPCPTPPNYLSSTVCPTLVAVCLHPLISTLLATSPPPHPLSPLSVSRTVTTTSQYAGTLLVSVTNPLDEAQTVLYAETLPWLLVPYLHTLRVSIDGIDARTNLLSILPQPHPNLQLFSERIRAPKLYSHRPLRTHAPPSAPTHPSRIHA